MALELNIQNQGGTVKVLNNQVSFNASKEQINMNIGFNIGIQINRSTKEITFADYNQPVIADTVKIADIKAALKAAIEELDTTI